MPVTAMPRKKSRKGLSMEAKAFVMTSLSRTAAMDSAMSSSPMKTSPRPATAMDAVTTFSFLEKRATKMPMPARAVAMMATGNSCKAAMSPVMQVPILAPMMSEVA